MIDKISEKIKEVLKDFGEPIFSTDDLEDKLILEIGKVVASENNGDQEKRALFICEFKKIGNCSMDKNQCPHVEPHYYHSNHKHNCSLAMCSVKTNVKCIPWNIGAHQAK